MDKYVCAYASLKKYICQAGASLMIACTGALLCACTSITSSQLPSTSEVEAIIEEAYIWGYPLVVMNRTRDAAVRRADPNGVITKHNEFRFTKRLATHRNRSVVMPNNDTLYASAWLDLSTEQVMLSVPDSGERYASLQLLDAYSNTIKIIRLNGGKKNTRPKFFLLVGKDWQGSVQDGVELVRVPTNMAWLLGRVMVQSVDDIDAASKVFEQFKLSARKSSQVLTDLSATTIPLGSPQSPADNGISFLDELAGLLRNNPPPTHDAIRMKRFARIGLSSDGKPTSWIQANGFTKSAEMAIKAADARVNDEAKRRMSGEAGWQYDEVGNITDNMTLRAATARRGLGALTSDEAIYFTLTLASDRTPLEGSTPRTLRLSPAKIPTNAGFWSLSLYDASEYFFIDNPLGRYSIGDRTPGLHVEPDGSILIHLSNVPPTTSLASTVNWLPAPKGAYVLLFRIYRPKGSPMDYVSALPIPVPR